MKKSSGSRKIAMRSVA